MNNESLLLQHIVSKGVRLSPSGRTTAGYLMVVLHHWSHVEM